MKQMKKNKSKILVATSLLSSTPLLLGVLTSCTTTVDEQYKITLNDEGKLVGDISYKEAIEAALSDPSCYVDFKSNLADEIVLKWYMDRMADSVNSPTKNQQFKIRYDEWIARINSDYDVVVQACRNKYGANYPFYLQNEYLTPNGGTEESYKHNQLLGKVREFFQEEVFKTDYFSYLTEKSESSLPIIYDNAKTSVTETELNDPSNWDKIGFYARSNNNFVPTSSSTDSEKDDYLTKHLDGDYATMQDFVFNRWFATEKPFFSAASLFKYSNPKKGSATNVEAVYHFDRIKIDPIPENPNEAFPFFGPKDIVSQQNEGTAGFYQWYKKLLETGFLTSYKVGTTTHPSNGTITIDNDLTEDSQTLLLTSGATMFNDLYTPYAIGQGTLYSQMYGYTSAYDIHNFLTKDQLVLPNENTWKSDVQTNNSFILSNFFYTRPLTDSDEANGITTKLKPLPNTISSYIDLQNLYSDNSSSAHTCNFDIFKKPNDYNDFNDFYGIEGKQLGARYITNNFQVFLSKSSDTSEQQPWVFELNESGMHVQTIDGFSAINKAAANEKSHVAKNLLKYRLMQYKNNYKKESFATDTNIFGTDGKLNTYFKNNYSNIILEMALNKWNQEQTSDINATNIFTNNFATKNAKENINFFDKVCEEQKFNNTNNVFKNYLDTTNRIDWYKKALENYNTANRKIYDYKKAAVDASKHAVLWDNTVYANGVLAPIGFEYDIIENNYDYWKNKIIFSTIPCDDTYYNFLNEPDSESYKRLQYEKLAKDITSLQNNDFVKLAKEAKINDETDPFSPQIIEAKKVEANSCWYKSPLVTKLFQATKTGKFLVNKIFADTYSQYLNRDSNEFDPQNWMWEKLTGNPLYTYFYSSKLLVNSDKNEKNNYNLLVTDKTKKQNYIENLISGWENQQNIKKVNDFSLFNEDEVALAKIKATIAWLMTTTNEKDSNYFKNLYNILKNRISVNEQACIGYLAKTNKLYFESDCNIEEKFDGESIYDWQADVENIFDQQKYHGLGSNKNNNLAEAKMIDSIYWKTVSKTIGNSQYLLAGFTGLVTESDDSLFTSKNGLSTAVFKELAKHSYNSPIGKSNDKVTTNTGIWFAYSSQTNDNGEPIKFSITSKDNQTLTENDFKNFPNVLGLAKAIVNKNSKESLRSFINQLIEQYYYSECPFKNIIDQSDFDVELDDLKYQLINVLPRDTSDKNGVINYRCFERLVNVQLHSNDGSDNDLKYSFVNSKTGEGYKLVFTQINRNDVVNKTLHPTSNSKAGVIDAEEFYNLVLSLAMDDSIQKMALNDIIRTCYHGDKLQVYDVIVNNLLDSTWVKKWSSKTYGK